MTGFSARTMGRAERSAGEDDGILADLFHGGIRDHEVRHHLHVLVPSEFLSFFRSGKQNRIRGRRIEVRCGIDAVGQPRIV